MSCNTELTNRLSTVTVIPLQNGRVTGQLTRLSGSAGYLTSVCDRGYKFDGWYDDSGDLMTESVQLYIPGWREMTVEPRQSEIIIDLTASQQLDAHEALVYYLELHGTSTGERNAAYFDIVQSWNFYSAGNYSTSANGSTTTILIDGTQVCKWPVTYGYNYALTDSENSQSGKTGMGVFDASNNTIHGTFKRSPLTHPIRDHISIPEILNMPKNTIGFPTQLTSRNLNDPLCTAISNYSWNASNFQGYNTPLDGSKPTQFPLLQYQQSTLINNTYHDEKIDFTGLEGGDFQGYYHRNYSYRGKRIRNWDPVSEWKDLRWFGSYAHNWKMTDATTFGGDSTSPRIIEPNAYNNNLIALHLAPENTNNGMRQAVDVNQNPTWVSQYSSKPQSGSLLHPIRCAPVNNISLMNYTYASDFSLTNNYLKSLNGLWMYSALPNYEDCGLGDIQSLSSLKNLYLGGHNPISSVDFLENAKNLTYINFSTSTVGRKLETLKGLANKKLKKVNLYSCASLIHDTLYDERVKLHMNFDSANILTQDSTRHVNKLNNYGATVTDT